MSISEETFANSIIRGSPKKVSVFHYFKEILDSGYRSERWKHVCGILRNTSVDRTIQKYSKRDYMFSKDTEVI